MELKDAESLALTLMQAHGVGDWNFKFDRAVRRFGQCSYTRKTISLSAPLTKVNEERQIADTILHEIAHALAGPYAKHGPEWRRMARSIGARPSSTGTGNSVAEARYVATCPGCGHQSRKHRRITVNRSCGKCSGSTFNPAFLMVYVDTRATGR